MNEWNQWLVISIIHLVDKWTRPLGQVLSLHILWAASSRFLLWTSSSRNGFSEPPLWATSSLGQDFSDILVLWAKTSLSFKFFDVCLLVFSDLPLFSGPSSLSKPLLCTKSSLSYFCCEPSLLSAVSSLSNLFAELLPLQATPFLSNLFSDRMILRGIGFSEPFLLWAASSLTYFLSQLLLLWPLPSLSYFSELPFLSPRSRVARELHYLVKLSFTLLLQCIWQHPVALPHSPRSRILSESMEHNSNAFRKDGLQSSIGRTNPARLHHLIPLWLTWWDASYPVTFVRNSGSFSTKIPWLKVRICLFHLKEVQQAWSVTISFYIQSIVLGNECFPNIWSSCEKGHDDMYIIDTYWYIWRTCKKQLSSLAVLWAGSIWVLQRCRASIHALNDTVLSHSVLSINLKTQKSREISQLSASYALCFTQCTSCFNACIRQVP